MEKVKINF